MKKFIFSLFGLLCATPVFAQVSTTGTGTVYAKPDCAHVSFSAHTENTAATVAYKDNRKLTDALWITFKAHKIAEGDIATNSFGITRSYDKDGKWTGFTCDHRINVTVRDLNDIGNLIDDAVTAGCNLNGIFFQVKNREALEKQARDLAIANAKAKAQQSATCLGAKLGAVKSISESSSYYQFPQFGMAYDLSPNTGRVTGGDRPITVQVNVTWDVNCSQCNSLPGPTPPSPGK